MNETKAWLENVFAGDFVDAIRADGGDLVPTGTSCDFMGVDGFSAPRGENDFGIGAAHLFGCDDALGGGAARFQMRKDVVAAGAFNQVADPAYARDQWVIPFLEVNARAGRGALDGRKARAEVAQKLLGFALAINDAPEQRECRLDLGKGALVCGEDGKAALDQFGGEGCLHV